MSPGQDAPFRMFADFDGDVEKMSKMGKEGDMPVLITRNMVNFPGILASVTIARDATRQLIQYIERHPDEQFAMFCQKDVNIEEPSAEDLCEYGVIAQFLKVFEIPGQSGRYAFIAQALTRCRITAVMSETPFIRAHVVPAMETEPSARDIEYCTLITDLHQRLLELFNKNDALPFELQMALNTAETAAFLVNMSSYHLPLKLQDKMMLLSDGDMMLRAYHLLEFVNRELQYANLRQEIHQRTQQSIDEEQKQYFLRHQLNTINKELGVDERKNPEIDKLLEKAKDKKWSEKVDAVFKKELNRLKQIHPQSSDYNVQLNYLQQIVDLPWESYTEDDMDLQRAQKILDRDHYGMEKVKERILEYIAVLSLRGDLKSPILCLYGPPGVGKTSLGKSIASALHRKYVRMSLGGLHDEAEIRGHRRTYVGAMPGRIIKNIEKAGSSNPVFILDEIDKVTQNTNNGDPASALLEVLDPEQNNAFHDNFLDLDYDLSKVMFIATANDLSTIPSPLRDRMEVIEVSGYTTEEKIEIAKRHLVPREKDKTGLSHKLKVENGKWKINPSMSSSLKIDFRKKALETIIERYTRESGVRQLEKQINKCLRKLAYYLTRDGQLPYEKIIVDCLEDLLGKPPFYRDIYQGNDYAGVVTGLAWTSVGGEILFIETSLSKGKGGKLTLTGNLGDVMKESATIALEYVKSHSELLGVDYRIFEQWNIHIHVPEGATPKDGPSAGITIATSIASALTQRKVRKNVAMTGEITLRGKVLPVGGIKEKILAAKRAGITDIMICEANRKDIEEIPQEYLKGVSFHYVEKVPDVWDFALTKQLVDNPIDLTIEDTDDNKS